MDLRRLRYFVVVAEQRHFGRAAERLFIAQPALSQQIKALEAELGVVLFTRSTRRVDLTPAGARLQQRAEEILRLVDATVEEVRRVHAGEEGTIRLGFIGSATYELMPQLSRALLADLPKLQVELKGEMLSPEVEHAVVQRSVDLGVLRPFPAQEGIATRRLRSDALVVAVPTDHPAAAAEAVPLADLASESFVNFPRSSSAMGDLVFEACATAGFEPRIETEVRETATLVSFVAAGLGVALVPASVRSVRIPGVVYLPLAGTQHSVDLVAAWRSDSSVATTAQALSRLVALVAAD